MTPQEFSKTMQRISQYWPKFYADQNADQIFEIWYPFFRDDPAIEVNKAVLELVSLLKFPPTIADIREQIGKGRDRGKMTFVQAFQILTEAVDRAYNRSDAAAAFASLPVILQNLAGSPSRLISWHKVSEDTWETVIMSALREDYKSLAKKETEYNALPAGLQKADAWMIEGPVLEALPEPEKPKTLDDLEAEQEEKTKAYRERYGMKPNEEYSDRVAAFLAPVTEAEKKALQRKDDARAEKYL